MTKEEKVFETLFKRYSSIANSYAIPKTRWWVGHCPALMPEEGSELEPLQVILLEKMDGSNISLLFTPNQPMKIGKRSSWAETFQNLDRLLPEKYGVEMAIFQAQADGSGTQIRIYGEVFGTGVINRVYYGEKKVRFYDLEIDNTRLPMKEVIKWFAKNKVAHLLVPIIGVFPTLKEALKFNVENMTSRLFPLWPDGRMNLWEGVVIKTYDTVVLVNETENERGSVFSLKLKREAFKEHKGVKTKSEIPQTLLDLNASFVTYLNANRMQSIFSQEGAITEAREIGKFIVLIQDDAKVDFLENNPEVAKMNKMELRRVFNGGATLAKLLKNYMSEQTL
jgi:Rnl2 family RNA ligase